MIDLILPGDDEIRKLAYELFELRGGEVGWDVADWLMAERVARFHKNYERVAFYLFDDLSTRYLGTRNPRVCRYCGKSARDVSFSKDAHAIPAFLGNRTIFSLYECNTCNNEFSEYLEDHFAKMLNGVRTVIRVHGRKSVPNYKTRRKLTRIEIVGDRIEIKQNVNDPVASVDQENQSTTFNLETQPFIPLAVYKCLAKIALSVMPESEIRYFLSTTNWVCERNHSIGAEDSSTPAPSGR